MHRCEKWPPGTVKGKLGPKLFINLADDGRKFDEEMGKLIEEIKMVTSKAQPADAPAPQSMAVRSQV